MSKTRRIRDPIHNLIVFDEKDDLQADMLAWQLINTPEFQRLRRIRQLGVSEFVFPGATHTRFSHSIGVYHNARRLLRVLRSRLTDFSEDQARTAALAALLHDVGHGPFSHAFENARRALGKKRGTPPAAHHEAFTAQLITADDSNIRAVLAAVDPGMPEAVARLFQAEDPTSIYDAIVSSSFDADRLDYLERDRYMTGTRVGAIDLEWLLDNLEIYKISSGQEEEEAEAPTLIPTFVFKDKARAAAEDFLLARYRLYTTVYLHKTTRGFEQLITALITEFGTEGVAQDSGIEPDHPLIAFLASGGGALEQYRQLDDQMVWGLVERVARGGTGHASELCRRLLARQRLRCLDLTARNAADPIFVDNMDRKIREHFENEMDHAVFADDPGLTLYTQVDGSDSMPHKRIRVWTDSKVEEISKFRDTIIGTELRKKQKLPRYYFLRDEDHEEARRIMQGS